MAKTKDKTDEQGDDGAPSLTPSDDQAKTNEPAAPVVKHVKMHREHLPGESGPVTADVHPDEVANYNAGGWRRSDPVDGE